jgi:hypothetical protein
VGHPWIREFIIGPFRSHLCAGINTGSFSWAVGPERLMGSVSGEQSKYQWLEEDRIVDRVEDVSLGIEGLIAFST